MQNMSGGPPTLEDLTFALLEASRRKDLSLVRDILTQIRVHRDRKIANACDAGLVVGTIRLSLEGEAEGPLTVELESESLAWRAYYRSRQLEPESDETEWACKPAESE